MCGIFGLLSLDGGRLAESVVRDGAEALAHRGPDVRTTWLDEANRVGLGHARLSIIDLSVSANQPFSNEDGSVLAIANGEIYNFRALGEELRRQGHRLRTRNDCECLPHLYEEYGADLPRQLDGMFAIALWDGQELFLWRDPFGKKPLFYCHQPGRSFLFASEIGPLLPHLQRREVDPDALLSYFACGYPVGDGSIFAGIHAVPPGGQVRFRARDEVLEVDRRWSFRPGREEGEGPAPRSENEWVSAVRDQFLAAVEKRLVSDMPLGAFWSGGVDSSAVVAALHVLSPNQRRHSFSIHFAESSFDPSQELEPVARQLGLEHHRVSFHAADLVDDFEAAMQGNAGLLADLSLLPMRKLARTARAELSVVLTGDGADELLAGYDTYRATSLARKLGPLRRLVAPLVAGAASLLPAGAGRGKLNRSVFLHQLAKGLSQRHLSAVHARWRQIFQLGDLSGLLSARGAALTAGISTLPDEALYAEVWDTAGGDWLARAQALDADTWLACGILPKVDRTTMAYGLEARSPFLDRDLAALFADLPSSLKLRHPKWVLRKAVEPWLPPALAWRKKEGFNTPLSRWFLAEPAARKLARHWTTSDQALAHGLLERSAIEGLWRRHERQDCHLQLWNLMVFNAWAHYFEPEFAL